VGHWKPSFSKFNTPFAFIVEVSLVEVLSAYFLELGNKIFLITIPPRESAAKLPRAFLRKLLRELASSNI
jgi:hypothetical protein